MPSAHTNFLPDRLPSGPEAGWLSSFFLILLLGVVTAANPAYGQTKRAGDTGYLKFGGGVSHYGTPLSDAISFAYVGEVGYQTSPNFAIGLAYQAGRYPVFGTFDNDRFTTQLLGRYTFGAKRWTIAPYIDAGGSLSFTGSDVGGGPTGGAGFDVALNDYASFYVEARTNLTYPETAMDDADFVPPFDEMTYLGAGFKLNFNTATTPPRVLALDGPTEAQTGESVTYSARINDDATRPVESQWDFGDGSTGTGLTASHTFADPGTYTVTFTASNEAGQASESLTVTATAPPQPASIISLNADPNPVDEGQPVQFSSNVQGDSPISYNWSFGDGASAEGQSPTHTYEEPGQYTARLEVSNEAGEDSGTLTVRVNRALPEICTTISELNSVFFEYNSSTLTDEAEKPLTENTDVLSKCPNLDVRVEGFAAPGERDPQALSDDRAEAVADFYEENGIDSGRITTSGEGQVEGVTTKKGGTRQYRRVDTIPLQGETSGGIGSSSGSMNDENSFVSGPAVQPQSGAPGSSPPEPAAEGWTIVVASMSKEAGAEALIQKYRTRFESTSLPVRIITTELEQGTRHRVVIGRFEDSDTATQALEKYEAKLPSGAWSLRLP